MKFEAARIVIGSFSLAERDARELLARYSGAAAHEIDSAMAALALPPNDAAAFCLPEFEILKLIEVHVIDAGQVPVEHRAHLQLRATSDGFQRYPVRSDTSRFDVVVEGGERSAIYRCDSGLWAFDILLPHALCAGDKVDISYTVTFSRAKRWPPEFRRVAPHQILDLTIELQFDSAARPKSVWWATWKDFSPESLPTSRELLELGDECTIRKHLSAVQRNVVGYCWEWQSS